MSEHVVHLGDCLDPVTGLASLPDKSVDHVICDPPFETEAHTCQRRVKRGGGIMKLEPLSFHPMTAEGRDRTAAEIARVVRRWVIAFCQIEAAMLWRASFERAGITYRRTGIWVKPDGMPQYTGDRPGMGYETLICMHVRAKSAWNGGGRHGVWTFPKMGPEDRERTGHETQKPLDLMLSLVRDFTDEGETVLDPFAGSCTTGVACKRLGRRFLGWEKDPRYFEIGKKRLDATREQMRMFEGSGS